MTTKEIAQTLSDKTQQACLGRKHVLCIQDTVESTYPTQRIKKAEFGPTGNSETPGFFIHPVLVVDAKNQEIVGVSHANAWMRTEAALAKKGEPNRTLEEKESVRWITAINASKPIFDEGVRITSIGDRENDFYDFFAQVPDSRTDVIVRAKHNRLLSNGEKLFDHMNQAKPQGSYELELPPITGKRKKRTAQIEIKFSEIVLPKPKHNTNDIDEEIKLTCIEAHEIGNIPRQEEPVQWRLLTTHSINTVMDARQIITWYTWRWMVEQLFRTMKTKGLHIENSEIETPQELLNLFVLGLVAAVKILALVYARDGTERSVTDFFTTNEIQCLTVLCKTLEGKTQKQKNLHNSKTLGWASWIMARLGGWNCYGSPPGPITMYNGLKVFEQRYAGWCLAKDVCIR